MVMCPFKVKISKSDPEPGYLIEKLDNSVFTVIEEDGDYKVTLREGAIREEHLYPGIDFAKIGANADKLDGYDASAFAFRDHTHRFIDLEDTPDNYLENAYLKFENGKLVWKKELASEKVKVTPEDTPGWLSEKFDPDIFEVISLGRNSYKITLKKGFLTEELVPFNLDLSKKNVNADKLDGYDASDFALKNHTHTFDDIEGIPCNWKNLNNKILIFNNGKISFTDPALLSATRIAFRVDVSHLSNLLPGMVLGEDLQLFDRNKHKISLVVEKVEDNTAIVVFLGIINIEANDGDFYYIDEAELKYATYWVRDRAVAVGFRNKLLKFKTGGH